MIHMVYMIQAVVCSMRADLLKEIKIGPSLNIARYHVSISRCVRDEHTYAVYSTRAQLYWSNCSRACTAHTIRTMRGTAHWHHACTQAQLMLRALSTTETKVLHTVPYRCASSTPVDTTQAINFAHQRGECQRSVRCTSHGRRGPRQSPSYSVGVSDTFRHLLR